MQAESTPNNSTKIRRTRRQWQTIVAEFEQSGLSAQAFCQQHAVAYSSFAKWRSLLKHQNADDLSHGISFIELPESSARLDNSAWRIELDLGAGVTLRLMR